MRSSRFFPLDLHFSEFFFLRCLGRKTIGTPFSKDYQQQRQTAASVFLVVLKEMVLLCQPLFFISRAGTPGATKVSLFPSRLVVVPRKRFPTRQLCYGDATSRLRLSSGLIINCVSLFSTFYGLRTFVRTGNALASVGPKGTSDYPLPLWFLSRLQEGQLVNILLKTVKKLLERQTLFQSVVNWRRYRSAIISSGLRKKR